MRLGRAAARACPEAREGAGRRGYHIRRAEPAPRFGEGARRRAPALQAVSSLIRPSPKTLVVPLRQASIPAVKPRTPFLAMLVGLALAAVLPALADHAVDDLVEDAQRALEDCLRDEPDWRGLLRVEPIEFNASASLN